MDNQQITDTSKIVLFSLDEPRYALYLSAVERVIHAVEITPLPKAPDKVFGVINFQGDIIPVMDIRKLFRLPTHDLSIHDQIIIARTSARLVGLVVDSVNGISEITENQITHTEKTLAFSDYLSGVTVFENSIILITDLEKFLSLDEQKILDKVLKKDTT